LTARSNQLSNLALGETLRLNRSILWTPPNFGPNQENLLSPVFSFHERISMDIVVSSKGVRNTVIAIVLAVMGITAMLVVPVIVAPKQQPATPLPPDAMAAVKGATAFYTLDFTEPPELWTLRVCGTTTADGCKVIQEFFAPSVRAAVDKYRIQTHAFVQPVQLVSNMGDRNIWKLEVTLTNPWDEESSAMAQNVFAEVATENGRWLLSRILFEHEAGHFITPTP
jgi:hypothetical protein